MGTLNVDKLDPESGTALEIGTSGDTVTVPSGVGLTLTDSTLLLPTTINTDKLDPKSGTDLEIGSSGDTITIPSGATITNSGTASGFGGGKIGQVLQAVKTDTASSTNTSFVDLTDMTIDITPAATSSKILVLVNPQVGISAGDYFLYLKLVRDSTDLYIGDAASNRQRVSSLNRDSLPQYLNSGTIMYLDSPS